MPRREEFIALPAFPGIALKQIELAEGYEFGEPRGGEVDIFKKETSKKGTSKLPKPKQATLECVCAFGSGGCNIETSGNQAFCSNDTCKNCAWKVKVPTADFVGYLGEVFQQ